MTDREKIESEIDDYISQLRDAIDSLEDAIYGDYEDAGEMAAIAEEALMTLGVKVSNTITKIANKYHNAD